MVAVLTAAAIPTISDDFRRRNDRRDRADAGTFPCDRNMVAAGTFAVLHLDIVALARLQRDGGGTARRRLAPLLKAGETRHGHDLGFVCRRFRGAQVHSSGIIGRDIEKVVARRRGGDHATNPPRIVIGHVLGWRQRR